MIAQAERQLPRVTGFRARLVIAMMLLVTAVTLVALFVAQRSLGERVEAELERDFQAELAALERAQEMRHAALVERCRALVRRPRIQQSLEEALDLLYLNANYELQDLTARPAGQENSVSRGLHAEFYRFLDRRGAVITPPQLRSEGMLAATEEARLSLPALTATPQLGYLTHRGPGGAVAVAEVIAMPIISIETHEPIGALASGFKPLDLASRDGGGMRNAIWLEGQLHGATLSGAARERLEPHVQRATASPVRVDVEGAPHLLFAKRLNPDSQYSPAYEVCVYPLAGLLARQQRLRWQVLGAGGVLLLLGLAASHLVAGRLSAPVEQLAADSEENRALRVRAEAALETTSAELQRSARFSADASHQLKTPVTVLRAGLEELLASDKLTAEECHALSALIHQTYRLSSLIEDLLLLSRMDAGRLKLALAPVDLSHLIEASLDDLSALPDELELQVETDFPPELIILGEKRYTAIILQNLLENARKYNHRGGRIRIAAQRDGEIARLRVANHGRPISAAAQEHIFERFHRGAMGENVPGYGLGLNLARELARLHQGDLCLLRSDEQWTEFEVRFRLASAPIAAGAEAAGGNQTA